MSLSSLPAFSVAQDLITLQLSRRLQILCYAAWPDMYYRQKVTYRPTTYLES